ncbi:MAG: hypothetical protein AB7G13_19250 [Lautropia sp.]
MAIPLPPAHPLAQLLGELVGRDVTARTAAKPVPADPRQLAVAAFDDEQKALRAVAYCDLPVAASLGAALILIPPGRVDESVKAKALDQQLTDNVYEVFNVMSSLFPRHGGPRLILRSVHHNGDVPDDVKAVLDRAAKLKPSERSDLDVEVAGYQSGRMVLIAA